MRGVTPDIGGIVNLIHISTHTPHARRDDLLNLVEDLATISTHTPHARRDSATHQGIFQIFSFLLTRLMRGVTKKPDSAGIDRRISTHTPHARRDMVAMEKIPGFFHFYSHASCEA